MASTYALPAKATSHHEHDFSASTPDAPFALTPFMSGRPRIRPRGESDLGRPSPRKGAAAAAFGFSPIEERESMSPAAPPAPWLALPEALTALLLPLPYIFASLAYPSTAAQGRPSAVSEEPLDPLSTETNALPLASQSLLHACALASITLIAVGAASKIRSTVSPPLDRRKHEHGSEHAGAAWSVGSLARIPSSILGLLLPFYASLQLGGAPTALALLVAVAAGLGGLDQKPGKHSLWDALRRTVRTRKATCGTLLVAMALHVFITADKRTALLGHAALAASILAVPPPLPTAGWSLKTGFKPSNGSITRASLPKASSALISTPEDTLLTLFSGIFLACVIVLYSAISSSPLSTAPHALAFSAFSVLSVMALVFFSLPSALRSQQKIGFAMGSLLVAAYGAYEHMGEWLSLALFPMASALLFGAVSFDTGSSISAPHSHNHSHAEHKHAHSHEHRLHGDRSKLSAFIIARSTPGSILHSILIEKDSRRIAYFGVLNLSFMLVQFFYGYVTGSLGLLTDSIHMLFDCAGLAVGLAAAVMSKWPPNTRFPYGFGKVDTLSGFANGVFLLLVSVEIIFDAIERLHEGSELHRLNELLIVSILGFLVNIVGLTAFGHAHHGHGHSHDHDHGDGDHSHGHHHHDNENMQGIFLHILADALGSVAVIISTLLTKYYGWSGWDPLASSIIALLIFGSAIPLVKSSGMRLLLSLPADVEYGIRNTLQELSSLRGVVGYAVPKFWLEDEGAAHSEVHAKEHGACDHSHATEKDHDHDHGHDHAPSLDHGHSHGHSHDLDSKDVHSEAHAHPRKHTAHQAHSHPLSHSHTPSHSHTHSHSHSDHDHGHDHSHGHSHDNHSHDHDDHDHDHSPAPRGQKVLGVIHIIASRAANLEDVRQRTVQFLSDRGMDVVVHVEKEGEGRCWCGGGNKTA